MLPPMSTETSDPGDRGVSLPLRIRNARIADAEAIEAVHYASREAAYSERVSEWPPAGPDRAGRVERWVSWLGDAEISCLIGEVNDEIVGFCTVRPSLDLDADRTSVAEMPTLYVHPDAWRRGYGRALCEAGLVRAVERGFRRLTLWVLEINTPACAFYEAFGFESDGVTKIDMSSRDGLIARRYRIDLGGAAA
jgi:ribosomal protein S18 acetylase RimI-like enzyme